MICHGNRWLLGLAPLAFVWAALNGTQTAQVESDIAGRVTAAAWPGEASRPNAIVEGRDVTLIGDIADEGGRARALATTQALPGVRRVADAMTVRASALPVELRAEKNGMTLTLSGQVSSETERAATLARARQAFASFSALSIADRLVVAQEAPHPPAPKPAEAAPVAAPAATPDATASRSAACQEKLTALLAGDRIRFQPGSSVLSPESTTLLDQLAAVALRCADASIEVAGHTDNLGSPGANQVLSRRRAQRVVDYLVQAGVRQDRLSAAGYGDQRPVASNETADGQARNRRIEFNVK